MKEKIKNILEELDEIGGMSECEISEVLKKDGINIQECKFWSVSQLDIPSSIRVSFLSEEMAWIFSLPSNILKNKP